MNSPTLKRITPRITSILAALMLAGCVSYSGIDPHATVTTPTDLALSDAKIQWPNDHAWEVLNDPVLNRLIEQALEHNPNIKIAKARFNQVSALAKGADANRLPSVGIDASMTPERFTENGLYPPPYAGSIYSTNSLMVDAKYEFDFWGKNRDVLAAAISNQKAAQAEIQSAQLLIEASVIKSYYSLANALEQRKIMEKNLVQREALYNLTHQLLSAGLETKQDLKNAELGMPAIRAFMYKFDEQIGLARNSLAALIGKGPDATKDLVASLPANIDRALPDSIPAELLGRRADISAARLRVEAAGKIIQATKTEFYPNVNLTAFAGFSSLGFAHWLDGTSRDYGVGPAINLPIFDGGRLRADLSSKTAEYDMAVESYNQTLIEAVHDVADQITSLRALEKERKEQYELLHTAEAIYSIAQQREKAGLVGQATVLNAQTNLLAQQSIEVQLRTQAIELNVNLVRALGGGFNEDVAPNANAPVAANNQN